MKKPRIFFINCLIIFLSVVPSFTSAAFLCGDANGDTKINLLDISHIINAIYRGGPDPVSWNAVDVNNSGQCDLLDVAYMINHIYRGGLEFVCPGDGASGGLIDHGWCKRFMNTTLSEASTSNMDGIFYHYDGIGMLSFTHNNAGFNCCPIIASIVTVEGNNIIVEELDSLEQGGCNCSCLFDLDYRISNLAPGIYHMKVIEPFVRDNMEQLEFDMDLSYETTAFYFVLRYEYPWID